MRTGAIKVGHAMGALALTLAGALAMAGCSSPEVVGSHDPIGPAVIIATVDRSVELTDGAQRLMGLSRGSSADELLGVIAPGADTGGAVVSIDTSDPDRSTILSPIEVDAAYRSSAASNPQVGAGWAISSAPRYGNTTVVVATGTQYGVIDDVDKAVEPGQFSGVVTDKAGSPIGPVTGVCVDGVSTGDEQVATWTVSGSDIIERHPYPTAVASGKAPEVTMLVSPMMSLRPAQRGVADAVGPGQPARLTATTSLAVGGLRSLSCLDDAQGKGLSEAADLQDGQIRAGGNGDTASALISVIDRGLADSWFTRGSQDDVKSVHYGEHYSMGLVGAASASGEHRLDAVLIDSVTGVVTAGIHLQGEGIPTDAQVKALALDPDGAGAWVGIDGSSSLRHVSFASN